MTSGARTEREMTAARLAGDVRRPEFEQVRRKLRCQRTGPRIRRHSSRHMKSSATGC